MIVVAVVGTALVVATALTLVMRPLLVVATGIAVFIAAGAWQATASDDGTGETPTGVAGFFLAAFWVLLPWLVGVAIGRLIVSRRTA